LTRAQAERVAAGILKTENAVTVGPIGSTAPTYCGWWEAGSPPSPPAKRGYTFVWLGTPYPIFAPDLFSILPPGLFPILNRAFWDKGDLMAFTAVHVEHPVTYYPKPC
jgi:hypothetical protein